ncbi:MAG: thioredoxin domain-containing protein [Deltaproteobacteria bacterium]|nr:thioredoxin domain-containing protein [Deltaproteobacteria bacterium]MBN2673364.1 thioredoxin domain-containing protein [Deltaproteobacteria bacterium]
MPDDKQTAPVKGAFLVFSAIAVLLLVGIGLAAELTRIHANTHQNPEFESMCAISDGLNCETVALSPYSIFLNLPVSVWGLFGYLTIFAVAVASLWKKAASPLYGAMFGLCTVAFLSSATLAFISFTKIDSLCLFCMGTYTVNTLLMTLVTVALVRGQRNPIRSIVDDITTLVRKPLLLGMLFIIGTAPIGVGYALITPYWQTAGFNEIPTLPTGVDTDGYHWVGAQTPKVTIIEYSDYECPYCRTAHRQLRELISHYAKDVRLVHRHFPLDQKCNPRVRQKFHQFACHFASAAECAAKQDKFWEMNDAIISSQDHQKPQTIDVEKFAIQLGIDRSEFDNCMKEETVQKDILRNINAGINDYVSATPTFMVNGQKFKGRITEEQLQRLLRVSE